MSGVGDATARRRWSASEMDGRTVIDFTLTEEQQALRDRLSRLRSLEPTERDRIRENAQRFQSLAPEDRERLRSAWRRLEQLPPEERRQRGRAPSARAPRAKKVPR